MVEEVAKVKKAFTHKQVSTKHLCRVCGKGIKERLVKIKERIPTLCYEHWNAHHQAKNS